MLDRIKQGIRNLVGKRKVAAEPREQGSGSALLEAGWRSHGSGDLKHAEECYLQLLQDQPANLDALYLLGRLRGQQGQLEDGLRLLKEVVARKPSFAEGWSDLGNVHTLQGNLDEAEAAYRRALELEPEHAGTWLNLGTLLLQQSNIKAAEQCFARAIDANPELAAAYMARGKTLLLLGQNMDANFCFREAIARGHNTAEPYVQLGKLCQSSDRLEEAKTYFKQALNLNYEDYETHYLLGMMYLQQQSYEDSADSFLAALQIQPDAPNAAFQLGNADKGMRHFEDASFHYLRAIELNPDFAEAYCQLGIVRYEQDRFEDATEMYHHAIRIKPRFAEAMNNLGHALQRLDRYEEAISWFKKAIYLMPELAESHLNLGFAYYNTGQYEAALLEFEDALRLKPSLLEARWYRSLVWLVQGQFNEGWPEYEYRFTVESVKPRHFPFPVWQGESLVGKTLLIYAEQGLGDEIMFSACLPDVTAKAGRCIIECEPRLTQLFSHSFPQAIVIGAERDEKPEWLHSIGTVDYQISAGSLPLHFRQSWENFPLHQGYLRADPERIAYWRSRLDALGEGAKIGISWRGGLVKTRKHLRSMDLASWQPILSQEGAHFINLQYGDIHSDLDTVKQLGMTIHHWQEAIDDFDDTAALVSALDVVITVCTAVVHLGGALGRPVWVMVPAIPEWRYLNRGETMPWYPSVRLIRQESLNSWQPVISKISVDLRSFIKSNQKK